MDAETIVTLGDRDHLLLRPDTLCGSTTAVEHVMPVYTLHRDSNTFTMCMQKLVFAPATRNLIQEIVTNALDRQYRDPTMKHIDVWVDCAQAGGAGYIRVRNDGLGVPVQMDAQKQAWQPTVAFSHFRSGTNFADGDGPRFTAGRNGYGCKATNVFSKVFTVKTADPRAQRVFEQTFRDNMSVASDARVLAYKLKKGYTDVSFLLDFARLGCEDGRMSEDVKQMTMSTIIHACGCLNKKVTLSLNGAPAPITQLKQLVALFGTDAEAVACDVIKDADGVTPLLEVCVTHRRPDVTSTLAFVNSLECNEGTHVNYALARIGHALEQSIKTKFRKAADFTLSPSLVKKHVFLAVKLLVDSPAFSSQTKEKLTTPHTRFNVSWTPSASFLKVLSADGGVLSALYQDVLDKELLLARKTMATSSATSGASGSSGRRHVVADKYDAATALRTTPAGRRSECSLLVTEGDSARALAVAGLAVVGREHFGIYALKGKPLNVRTASTEAIAKNKEISTLLQILGLTFGKVYTSLNELNYRKLVIFSDQDYDGAHIGGLILNVIHTLFPSVLALDPAFVQRFPTPLVRATHNRTGAVHVFYAKPEFDTWAAATTTLSHYTIRYFKGLGTSTSALAREYFSAYSNTLVDIVWTRASDDVMLHMFGGDHATERRQLLLQKYDKDVFADYTQRTITYEDFVYREVLPYSNYSNVRNIASVIDGFKPVQRKALYTLLDKNVVHDMKVAQVAALVASHTMYHHGEQSLVETVVGMAQDHVGVSNINLFKPEGQFGSRLDPPSEHSAARYIFTALDDVTRHLFCAADDAVLTRVEEEGAVIEPVYYVPVIPMVLVNGAFGIGTGWSSNVPCFNPMDLIDVCTAYIHDLSQGGDGVAVVNALCAPDRLVPWYDGFKGTIVADASTGTYKTRGCFTVDAARSTIHITELPVGVWTHPFVEAVEKKMMGGGAKEKEGKSPSTKKRSLAHNLVEAIDKEWTDATVDMTLHCNPDALQQLLQAGVDAVAKELGLESELRLSNMHLHDASNRLRKYDSTAAIVLDFAQVRVALYVKRQQHLLSVLEKQLVVAQQKARFISERVFYELRDKTDEQVQQLLAHMRFVQVDGDYNYLLNMTFKSLTLVRCEALQAQVVELEAQLHTLRGATPASLWLQDLAAARTAIDAFRVRKAARYAPSAPSASSAVKAARKVKAPGHATKRRK